MDEGWTRWLLEQYQFDFENLRDSDFQAGNLRERFDVILIAEPGGESLLDGFAEGEVPPRYAGGLGPPGVRALDAFVRDGGTLVCLNRASRFAIEELHLPVTDVVGELERTDFYASGSILEVEVDTAHPVMAGMPERAKVFFARGPVFTTTEGFQGRALAKYQPAGTPLLSGYLLGSEHLNRQAAALDVHHGKGHVLLFGFRPQWRGQPLGTLRVLFNAVLFQGALAAEAPATAEFWSPAPPTPAASEPASSEESISIPPGP